MSDVDAPANGNGTVFSRVIGTKLGAVNAWKRIQIEAILAHLYARQEYFLFKPTTRNTLPPRHPSEYEEFEGMQVAEHFLDTEKGIKLSLYEKKAEPGMPHYLLFHGNTDSWMEVNDSPFVGREEQRIKKDREQKGIAPLQPLKGNERRKFLHSVGKMGAGFTAVELRGYGKSNGNPGETVFRTDIQAIVSDILKRMPGKQIIVAGESMGGATAAIALAEMVAQGQPPAQYMAINTFCNMAAAIAGVMGHRDHSILRWLSQHPNIDQIAKKLRHPFKTDETLAQVADNPQVRRLTDFLIAYAPNDEYVDSDNSKKLIHSLRGKRAQVTEFLFDRDCSHCIWPHEGVIAASLSRFKERQQPVRTSGSYLADTIYPGSSGVSALLARSTPHQSMAR